MNITYDDEIEYWRLELPRGEDIVHVAVDDSYEESELEAVAQKALSRVENKWGEIEQNIINALLDRYNSDFNEGTALDSDTFVGQFSIELLSVEEEGELEIYFDDQDLFKQKWVTLEIESDDTIPMQAELIG